MGVYRIGHVPNAIEELREIASRARQASKSQFVAQSLQQIMDRLRTAPLDFGEIKRHTHKAGGVVHLAVVRPLAVWFAIYDEEKVVLILKYLSLPRAFDA